MVNHLKTLLRVVGIIVPGAGGALTILFALPVSQLAQSISQAVRLDASLGVALGLMLLMVIFGLLSALLLRSWRSLVIVPASFFVGWEVGTVGDAVAQGQVVDGYTLLNAAGTALLLLAPVLLGAAVGTGLSLRGPRGGTPEQRLKLAAQAKWLGLPA